MSFWIVTDAACDLTKSYVDQQEKFHVMPMSYHMDNQDYPVTCGEKETWHPFYEALRNGKMATTSQVNTAEYLNVFKRLTEKGESVLCIVFSSGLSGTYQAACLAQSMLQEENPNAKVTVVDSLCASAGQGLIVHLALQKRAEGASLSETAQWVMENRQNIVHWFTVDDLDFLRRGGRVSATAAYFGGMLKIKPVMHVNFEGKLIPREKVQGRKRALKTLAQKVNELAQPRDGQTVFISHGDCEDDARYTIACLQEMGFAPKDVMYMPISPIVGAHAGPGTVAIFFLGESR